MRNACVLLMGNSSASAAYVAPAQRARRSSRTISSSKIAVFTSMPFSVFAT